MTFEFHRAATQLPTVEEIAEKYKTLFKQQVEDDTDTEKQLQEMARPYLSDLELFGDSNGVPGIGGIAETLCDKLAVLTTENSQLREELKQEQAKLHELAKLLR